MKNLKEDSVIQITKSAEERFVGCLMQVDEVKTWGVTGWTQTPTEDRQFIRVKNDHFVLIGQAVIIPEKGFYGADKKKN